MTERVDANGNAHDLAHSACTAPHCGLGASTVGLVATVVSNMGSDSGKITIREVFAVEWTLTQVNITSFSTLLCSIAEGVTESGAKNGS